MANNIQTVFNNVTLTNSYAGNVATVDVGGGPAVLYASYTPGTGTTSVEILLEMSPDAGTTYYTPASANGTALTSQLVTFTAGAAARTLRIDVSKIVTNSTETVGQIYGWEGKLRISVKATGPAATPKLTLYLAATPKPGA